MKKYNIILAVMMVVTIIINSTYGILNNMATGLEVFKNYIEVKLVNGNSNNSYTVEEYINEKLVKDDENNDRVELYYSDKDTIKCIYITTDVYSEKDDLKLKMNIKKNNGVIVGRNVDIKPQTKQNLFYEFDCEKGELIPAKERKIGIPKTASDRMRSIFTNIVVIWDIIFIVYLVIYFKKRVKLSNKDDKVKDKK